MGSGTDSGEVTMRMEDVDNVVPNASVWLHGPRASATQVGVRGFRYPPFDNRGLTATAIHAYALILYVDGRTSIERTIGHEVERCEVGPGDLSLQPALVSASWRWLNPIDVLHVYIEPAYLREIAREEVGGCPTLHVRHGLRMTDNTLVQMGVDLIEELRVPSAFASMRSARAIGDRLAIHLLRNYFDLNRPGDRPRTFSTSESAALRAFVAEHLGDALRLSEMAKVVGLGVHHFCRVFRDTFGRSPHDYVREQRLDRAHELLVTGSRSVSEIALLTGFADQSHLTRCFKQRFGVPPAQLRRESSPSLPRSTRD
jgi:AraC family transcriptional regulator